MVQRGTIPERLAQIENTTKKNTEILDSLKAKIEQMECKIQSIESNSHIAPIITMVLAIVASKKEIQQLRDIVDEMRIETDVSENIDLDSIIDIEGLENIELK
ncbi:hypothetical protein D3C87_941660 [compost metagenome]